MANFEQFGTSGAQQQRPEVSDKSPEKMKERILQAAEEVRNEERAALQRKMTGLERIVSVSDARAILDEIKKRFAL